MLDKNNQGSFIWSLQANSPWMETNLLSATKSVSAQRCLWWVPEAFKAPLYSVLLLQNTVSKKDTH